MGLRIEIVPRTLRFKFAAGTSRGVYHQRDVWMLQLRDTERTLFAGLGECAPLPDLSMDYTEDYGECLRRVCSQVEREGVLHVEKLRDKPSMLAGLEMAFMNAQAAELGRPWLEDSAFLSGESGITINGLVWMGQRELMMERLQTKLDEGFRCVKVKIGAIDFDDELALLACVRASHGREEVELRVDANGAFRPDEALSRLEKLASFGIHSIEQPIKAGQWEAMAEVCRNSPIPVALDEELIGVTSKSEKCRLLETVRPAYLVLKPTLHGGFSGSEEWIRLAEERGIGWWVTSALESNVGLLAIAKWASCMHEKYGKASVLPSGLGTGQLYTNNIPEPRLQIRGDELWYTP